MVPPKGGPAGGSEQNDQQNPQRENNKTRRRNKRNKGILIARQGMEEKLGRPIQPGEYYQVTNDRFHIVPADQVNNGIVIAGRFEVDLGKPVAWGEMSEGIEEGVHAQDFRMLFNQGRYEWYRKDRINADGNLKDGGPTGKDEDADDEDTLAGRAGGQPSGNDTSGASTRTASPMPFIFGGPSGSGSTASQTAQLSSLNEQVERLNREKLSATNELTVARERCDEEKKRLENEIEEERKRRAEAEQKAAEVQEKEQTCQTDLRSAEARLKAAATERDQLNETILILRDDIEEFKSAARDKDVRYNDAIDDKNISIEKAELRIKEQQEELAKLRRFSTQSNTDMVDSLRDQVATLKERYEEAQRYSDSDRLRAQELEDAIQAKNLELRGKDERITEKDQQLREYDLQLMEKNKEVEKFKRDNTSLSSENRRLKQDNSRLQGNIDSLNTAAEDNRQLGQQYRDLQQEHDKCKRMLDEGASLGIMYQALEVQYRILQEEYNTTLDKLMEIESANVGLREDAKIRSPERQSNSPVVPRGTRADLDIPDFDDEDIDERASYADDDGTGPCPHCSCPRGDIQHSDQTSTDLANETLLAANERANKLQGEIDQAAADRARIAGDLDSANTKLSLAEENLLAANERANNLQGEIDQAVTDSAKISEDLDSANTKLSLAESQREVAQKELELAKVQLTQAQSDLATMTQELNNARATEELTKGQLTQAESDIATITQELNTARAAQVATAQELSEARDNLDRITTERDESLQQQANMAEEGDRLRDSLRTVTSERDGLQEQLTVMTGLRDELRQTLETQRGNEGALLASAIEERDRVRREYDEQTAQLDTITAQCDQLRTERNQFQQNLAEMTRHRDQLQLILDAQAADAVTPQRLARRTEERDAAREERDRLNHQLDALTDERNTAIRQRDSPCPHCGLLRSDSLGQQRGQVSRYHINPIVCWVQTYKHLWLLFVSWFGSIVSIVRQLFGQSALQGRTGALPSLPRTLSDVAVHLLIYYFLYSAYLVYTERSMWFDLNPIPTRLIQEWRYQRPAHSIIEHFFPEQSLPWPLDDIRYHYEIWLLHDRSLPG